jgi:hypothetical protein
MVEPNLSRAAASVEVPSRGQWDGHGAEREMVNMNVRVSHDGCSLAHRAGNGNNYRDRRILSR